MALKRDVRENVYRKYDGHCAYCGNEIKYEEMQVDHIIPQYNFLWHIKNNWKIPVFLRHLTELDVNHIDNLFPACRTCNKWKSTYSLDVFRSEIEEQVKRLNSYNANYRMAKKYDLIKEEIKPIVFYFEKNVV